MSQHPKTVVTFSGGMDSTTLLYHLRSLGHEVLAIGVDYGQRHRVELDRGQKVLTELGVDHRMVDLSSIAALLGGSSQTDPTVAVPQGHYAEDSMKTTVVPNRNMILLAVAAAWAISEKADHVAYAAHAGDHTIYPDCRPEFADRVGEAIAIADWHSVQLIRPFIEMSKADIVSIGADLGVPFEATWSCYEGGDVHCGACGTCVERREAFLLAGVEDPTPYDDQAPAMRKTSGGEYEIDWHTTANGDPRPAGEVRAAEATA